MVRVANLSLVKPVFPAAQFTQRIPSDLFYPDKEGTLTSFINNPKVKLLSPYRISNDYYILRSTSFTVLTVMDQSVAKHGKGSKIVCSIGNSIF